MQRLRLSYVWIAPQARGVYAKTPERSTVMSQMYRRKLNRSMLQPLEKLYMDYKYGEFARTKDLIKNQNEGADFAKLRYWGLIAPGVKRGTWRITLEGELFVEGKIQVSKYVWVYQGKRVEHPDQKYFRVTIPQVYIHQVDPKAPTKEDALRDSKSATEEKWNENVQECSDCGVQWKKIGKPCKVCYAPPEKTTTTEGG